MECLDEVPLLLTNVFRYFARNVLLSAASPGSCLLDGLVSAMWRPTAESLRHRGCRRGRLCRPGVSPHAGNPPSLSPQVAEMDVLLVPALTLQNESPSNSAYTMFIIHDDLYLWQARRARLMLDVQPAQKG